jgi:hypothetical protein
MKRRILPKLLGGLVVLAVAALAGANDLLQVPEDGTPPFYLSGGGPFVLDDGTPWAMQDGTWAAIPFYRSPDAILASDPDFDLLHDFDPNVFDAPLYIKGWVEFTDDMQVRRWQSRGTGALPIAFVRWDELQAVMADGRLTIGELATLPSLRMGTATFYQEENHSYGVAEVSHLAVEARGTLAGGGSFKLKVVEVGLELKEVQIVFE